MKKNLRIGIVIWSMLGMASAAEKPNVVFIFTDDHAYEAIGALGHIDIDTPHLDRFVKNGTTFSHAYNMGAWGGAVCVSSRSMLLTGRSLWDAQKVDFEKLVAAKESWPLMMKQAGYDTYMTGKWHVPKASPANHFDQVVNVRKGMPDAKKSGYDRPKSPDDYAKGWKPWDPEMGGFWAGGKHWSEVLADDSIAFIKTASQKESPFFMYLAFNAPHDPRQAPKENIAQYPLDRIKVPATFQPVHPYVEQMCGKGLRDEKLMPYPRTEYAVKVHRQEYFAIISHLDEQIGRILDAIEASGKADNTYIFFTADHGLAVGHHGLSGKQNMYDHSLRVPFMVTGPGVEKGKTISTPIYLQDVASTSIELAGAAIPESYFFKSLLPLMKGESGNHYEVITGNYMNTQQAVIQDQWKLISIPKADAFELYDLKNDSWEARNLADDPEHLAKKKELLALLKKVNPVAPSPRKKRKGKK